MSEPLSLEEAIRLKLAGTLGAVSYEDIAQHLAADAVFVVAKSLSIVECGVAVAMDDVTRVEGWIKSGELRKPTIDERTGWPDVPAKTWTAIVVHPFVLVQDPEELPDA